MKKLLAILFLAFSSSLFTYCDAQYTDLFNFDGTNGSGPSGDLTIIGNRLYGMTPYGAAGWGCIFSIDTNGSEYKYVYIFDGTSANPKGSLTYSGKSFYGMTEHGGAHNYGCVFSVDTGGTDYKDLLDFDSLNGMNPMGNVTLCGSSLFGMTEGGGAYNYGCIFSVDTDGSSYRYLLDFNGTNGLYPYGSLTLSGNKLFGQTQEGGGTYHYGNIFYIDTDGIGYRDLFDFDYTDGGLPLGSLLISGNTMYGLANTGGANSLGCVFSIDTNGTDYKDLFDFNGTNGENPAGSLILSGNTLFGMTQSGGAFLYTGNIFSIDTDGTSFTDLFDFNGSDGGLPTGSLTHSGNILYGMTQESRSIYGLVFSFKDTTIKTSINNFTTPKEPINIYPNPNSGLFTIQSSVVSIQSSIEIYNALGQQVYSTFLPQTPKGALNEINIGNQPNGIYLYRVMANSGELMGEGKVIIQK